jgi:histidine phosphotransfer protein HptB
MSEYSVFDRTSYLLLKSELGAEDTAEVLRIFLQDTSRKMTVFAQGALDPGQARHEAHAIKSSAANFGFSKLSCLACKIESEAMGMSPAQLREAITALQTSFKETRDFAHLALLCPKREVA